MAEPGGSESGRTERVDPPFGGDELVVLRGFLGFARATIRSKTDGLDAEQLARRHPPSAMTLGGMLMHLTYVEDFWTGVVLHGAEPDAPWRDVDWHADPDYDWHVADGEPPDELRARFDAAIRASEERIERALADGGLDRRAERTVFASRERVDLRWILQHLCEEHFRHAGHADLLREAIDGAVGE